MPLPDSFRSGWQMSIIEWLGEIWGTALVTWAALCVLFFVLTRISPCNPNRNWWTARRAAFTDLVYWLVMPVLSQVSRVVLLVLGVWIIYGSNPSSETFAAIQLPIWCQCIIILLAQDVMMYWIHRVFHTRFAWKIHAVHHSPEVLDWMSAARTHPLNAIGEYALVDAIVLLAGFSPFALAILAPINLFYSAMVHANLNWTFGPLKYILASPVFHRWHHTTETEGLDRNFASTFPFLDWMWGTYYMPEGRKPEVYGTRETVLPAGFIGQTAYPGWGAWAWSTRHPLIGTCIVVMCCGSSVYTWQQLTTPTVVAQGDLSQYEPPPQLLKLSKSQPQAATAVAVNADTERIVTGYLDGTVIICNVATGREIVKERLTARVNAVAISPNGSYAACACGDGSTHVYRCETGEALRTMKQPRQNVMSVAVANDGWVATGTVNGRARVWDDRGTMAKSRALGMGAINAISVSDAGRVVAVGAASQVAIWNIATDTLMNCDGPRDLVYCLAMSPDCHIICGGDYQGKLYVWAPGNATPRYCRDAHTGPVYSISMSNDAKTILTGGADKMVRTWDVSAGGLTKELNGHDGLIFAVSTDARNDRVIATGKEAKLTQWNRDAGQIIQTGATMP